jgi:DNA-binding transcriptional LysR family regulator
MLEKLEFLLLLARERHFGRAAEAAGVTQPTLSSAIKSLEESLGATLVERGSRFRGFTPEGERVLRWARRLVSDARTMRQELQSLKGSLSGHLRIGVVPTALSFVSHLTIPYIRRFPGVQLSVFSATSAEILSQLDNLEVDVGISYIDNEPIGRMSVVPLYEEQFMLLVNARSPLAHLEEIAWADAAKLPLCLLTPDTQSRRIIDNVFEQLGGIRTPALQSNSMMTLFTHVRTSHWVSILPWRPRDTIDGLRQLKAVRLVSPGVKKAIGLLVRGREPHSPAVSAFVALTNRVIATTVELPERDKAKAQIR